MHVSDFKFVLFYVLNCKLTQNQKKRYTNYDKIDCCD